MVMAPTESGSSKCAAPDTTNVFINQALAEDASMTTGTDASMNSITFDASYPATFSTLELSPSPLEKPLDYNGLPTELRLKIIQQTFEEPQVVANEFFAPVYRKDGWPDEPYPSGHPLRIPPPLRDTPVPIALHINRESRIEALRHHQIVSHRPLPDHMKLRWPIIYLKSSVDTLVVKMLGEYATTHHLSYETNFLITSLRYIEYPRSRTVIFLREPREWYTDLHGLDDWSRESDTEIFDPGAFSTCNRMLGQILALFHKEYMCAREPKQPRIMIYCATAPATGNASPDVTHNRQLAEKMNI
ncbi:hypothetical protein GLAREA_06674 [Glarea lozoyensis ATCC 20868]|uniref:2EXR domain-containing protein n=1 Tax=Glarea lozoyensis (strain ATCC 20868 / MF5171) TaxID=1116229 RepID=S3DNI8_GLAL2|nr:uncharacterized protein GLAREA_06674 [Glarea lozoyensis ATCC 20868]EPE33661.1 hypothetical protein GLAREA_06674 [Glarea lozoyensis ATCC 20868]